MQFNGYSSDLILQFHKVGRRTKDKKKSQAAEAGVSWFLVPSVGQAPQTLGPTFPIMQPTASFC